MKLDKRWVAAALVLLGLYIIGSSFYVLRESQLALLIRLGAPTGVISEPGLKFKVPFIDSLVFYDGRPQILLPPTEQVILGDQKRIEVDTYAHFRISDPLRFYQAVRTLEQANAELTQMISSSLRRELGQVQLLSLLSVAREQTVAKIEKDVADRASALGIEVTEVRLHRADLPAETSQAIYDRMTSERQREAKELRAQGFEWAQQIQAKADSEVPCSCPKTQSQANDHPRRSGCRAPTGFFPRPSARTPSSTSCIARCRRTGNRWPTPSPRCILTPDAAFLKQFTTGPAGAASAK